MLMSVLTVTHTTYTKAWLYRVPNRTLWNKLPIITAHQPAPFIHYEICCYSQDEDEVWQSRLFRLWTCCVEQFAV